MATLPTGRPTAVINSVRLSGQGSVTWMEPPETEVRNAAVRKSWTAYEMTHPLGLPQTRLEGFLG